MRVTSSLALLALSPLALAEQPHTAQHPLASLYDQYSSFIPAALRPASNPFAHDFAAEAAAKVAAKNVHPLTLANWRSTLSKATTRTGKKADDSDVWMVYVTGGNKTCYGLCGDADKAWNESALRLAASLNSPSLASVNCDQSPVLCNSWGASPPAVWHITLPLTAGAPTDIRVIGLNATAVAISEITEIHTKATWEKQPLLTGMLHPFDGQIAKLQLSEPLGYILWGFSIFPSWVYMLVISFASRSLMGKRGTAQAGPAAAAGPRTGAPPGDARL